uniref:Centromere protein P n=1 Tax=Gopherus evgoodei TaxID=1825980 RepID=A0A8C4Y5T5_9SAUR
MLFVPLYPNLALPSGRQPLPFPIAAGDGPEAAALCFPIYRFELMIVWKIYVDEEGRVTPILDLLPRIPVQAVQDKQAAVENGPQCFRNMLLLLGIEASIESLIKSVEQSGG